MKRENHKSRLRAHFSSLRKSLPLERSLEAAHTACRAIASLPHRYIGSFFPIHSEIDLSFLNTHLSSMQRLALPRVEGAHLAFYQVFDLNHLILSPLGIPEPDPSLCPPAPSLDLMLIPALAFDERGYRLGYGKGFYDRTLSQTPLIEALGVGFTEQKSPLFLPTDPWDIPVKKLLLF